MTRRLIRRLRERPLVVVLVGALLALLPLGLLAYSCAATPGRPAPETGPPPPSPRALRVLLASLSGADRLDLRIGGTAWLEFPEDAAAPRRELGDGIVLAREEQEVVAGDGIRGRTARLGGLEGTVFSAKGATYPGDLVVSPAPGPGLRVILEVDLETYLLGVVGGEMPASWEMDALKAQAVAARTYAADRRRDARRRGAPFDVFDDTRSQVYAGLPAGPHRTRIEEAVRATAGEVLVYGGALVPAFFHSTCGGHTEDVRRVFVTPGIPPLEGVACDGCADSPAFRWEARVPNARLAEAFGVGPVRAVRGLEAGPSGRLRKVVVVGEAGERIVTAKAFRETVGNTVLKSTAFEAEVAGEEVVFRGRGYGHGVGLCQWGARGLARAGRDYFEILARYYPGAVVLPVDALEPAE